MTFRGSRFGEDGQLHRSDLDAFEFQRAVIRGALAVVGSRSLPVRFDENIVDCLALYLAFDAENPPWPRIAHRWRIVHRRFQRVDHVFGDRLACEMTHVPPPFQKLEKASRSEGENCIDCRPIWKRKR